MNKPAITRCNSNHFMILQKNQSMMSTRHDSLIALFCNVDNFCQEFLPVWHRYLLENKPKKLNWPWQISVSEIMTTYIHFQRSFYQNFKNYYTNHVSIHLKSYFPYTLSYPRFVILIKSILVLLGVFMQSMTEKKKIFFVDSTIIDVCYIKREQQNRVFKGIIQKGKSSMG